MIKAEIMADSINEFGNRITTFKCVFPRIILAELNTHRALSRNSASSRAIPFNKMVKMVKENPFVPIAWQKDHKGMQGKEYFTSRNQIQGNINKWLKARDNAVNQADFLYMGFPEDPTGAGVTKQLCNRLLEPFMWHTAIVTATELENFFTLRCPQYIFGKNTENPKIWRSRKDACKYFPDWVFNNELFWNSLNEGQGEIHIMALAEAMWDAVNESKPKKLKVGEWHIPFGDKMDEDKIYDLLSESLISDTTPTTKQIQDTKVKIATARCARVSYLNFEGKDDYEADIKLYDRLASMGHMSPFEHCARAMDKKEYDSNVNGKLCNETAKMPNFSNKYLIEYEDVELYDVYDEICGWSGNFRGFVQLRKTIKGENKTSR